MNADKMLENEGYVYSNTIFTSDKKTVVNYIDNHVKKRITFILEDKRWFAETFLNAQVTKAVLKKCEEMGWIESDKKQAINSESNLEHYFDDLLKAGSRFTFINEKVENCDSVMCSKCSFCGDCVAKRFKWLASQYRKPTYNLTQFEFDLINTFGRCKECCLLNEIECLKKLREKGYFKCIDPFTKVHEIIENCEVVKDKE